MATALFLQPGLGIRLSEIVVMVTLLATNISAIHWTCLLDFFFDTSQPTISPSALARNYTEPCRTKLVNCFKGQEPVHSEETASMVRLPACMHAWLHGSPKKKGWYLDRIPCMNSLFFTI